MAELDQVLETFLTFDQLCQVFFMFNALLWFKYIFNGGKALQEVIAYFCLAPGLLDIYEH